MLSFRFFKVPNHKDQVLMVAVRIWLPQGAYCPKATLKPINLVPKRATLLEFVTILPQKLPIYYCLSYFKHVN
ncbi:hypothetical protein MTsPCn5_32800 [Croceitalea sp. MTPC5]|nr:hypothetical protein MTsPCn5_32800 [Croceitalea sp. MTPC5]